MPKRTKEKQLDIFAFQEFGPNKEIAPDIPKQRRKRKPREVKKAPMLVDSFSASGVQRPVVSDEQTETTDHRPSTIDHQPAVAIEPHIHTISEITEKLKGMIESEFPEIWLVGEITDFKNRTGRHLYFSLKDEKSKMRAVIFGADGLNFKFDLVDGLEVICHGRLNVYVPQGQYSIIIDHIEPKGKGALHIAFEQLKKKLEEEGLFSSARKRPLPYLPRRIGVVTSPTGAAIRDIVHVLTRRFPNIDILLHPVRVQGEGAAGEIVDAIRVMNTIAGIDLLIVGRGGGSIEDLWAFNEEIVARAIVASAIPVISAVGHEIDFTIADFTADLRAATPSAAAEIAVPVKSELMQTIMDTRRKLALALKQVIANRAREIVGLSKRIADPRKKFPDYLMRIDSLRERVLYATRVGMERRTQVIASFAANLNHLSPLGILSKGYAVAQKTDGSTVRSSKFIKVGDELNLRFHEGSAKTNVTKVN